MQELINRTVRQLTAIAHKCMEANLKDGTDAKVELPAIETMEAVHQARQLIEEFIAHNRGGGR